MHLAQLLGERGATRCEAEQRHGDDIPDVLFEWFGLECVLEAKYESPGAGAQLGMQVADRLRSGFGTLGVALRYPAELGEATGAVHDTLTVALFRVQLSAIGRPAGEWQDVAGVDRLVEVFDSARAFLIDDDELAASVRLLGEAVNALARGFAAQPGHLSDLAHLMTAVEATSKVGPTPEEQSDAGRVAALAVITALMLQLVLADRDPSVPNVELSDPQSQRRVLLRGWTAILEHDYRAVFEIAHDTLSLFGDTDPRLGVTLVDTIRRTQGIVAKGVFGRHDLVGRIYHTLLAQQKYLATYYTSVPCATLLAALATSPARWPTIDWAAEPGDFAFTLADPACGTGTLLAACLTSLRGSYAGARLRAGKPVDALALGRRLIEDNIFGMDILAYAVQVCASTLLLSTPGTTVHKANLIQFPFGGPEGHLGSLDLLMSGARGVEGVLFGAAGTTITADGVAERSVGIELPAVDLVIMNPPFTRTQGGSRLLGSLTPGEWPTARRALDSLGKRYDILGRVVAGLGAMFVPLADRMLAPGGRLALVLPKTMLTGAQWDLTRQLLASTYHVETVVVSHEPGRWNFSDSTSLAEVLLVARKLTDSENRSGYQTTWVQLTTNPDNAIDALGIASAISQMGEAETNARELSLRAGMFASVGQVFSRPAPTTPEPWRHAVFASEEMDRFADAITRGEAVRFPRSVGSFQIPVVPLGDEADVGPDTARIHDAFALSTLVTSYPCVWGHESSAVKTVSATAGRWLAVSTTSKREPNHALRYAAELWQGSGSVLIPERLRLTTHRVGALSLSSRVLGNSWWPVMLHEEDPERDRMLTLWMNSIFGLTSWVWSAEETEGPWLKMKKNKLVQLPVVDPKRLSHKGRAALAECWKRVHAAELMPISQVAMDPVRSEIDAAFTSALELPADGVEGIRRLFSAEPRLQPIPHKLHRVDVVDGLPDSGPSLFS